MWEPSDSESDSDSSDEGDMEPLGLEDIGALRLPIYNGMPLLQEYVLLRGAPLPAAVRGTGCLTPCFRLSPA